MSLHPDLDSAISATLQPWGKLANFARNINEPELREALTLLVTQLSSLHERHSSGAKRETVVYEYVELRRLLEHRSFCALEDGLEGSDAWWIVSLLGNLDRRIGSVLRCASLHGMVADYSYADLPSQASLDRVGFEKQIEAILAHAREARRLVDDRVAPEAQMPDQPELQRALIRDFVQEYNITDNSVRITLSVGEGIDLAVLERGVSRLATITREMTDTVRVWGGKTKERIGDALVAVRTSVRRIVGSIATTMITALKRTDRENVESRNELAEVKTESQFDAYERISSYSFIEKTRQMIISNREPPYYAIPHIRNLNVSRTNITSIENISKLVALQFLNVSSTDISNLSDIKYLTELRRLDLSNNKIEDLRPLTSLNLLAILLLDSCILDDISPIFSIKNLRKFDIANSNVSEFPKSVINTSLRSINITGSKIRDASSISHLKIKIYCANERQMQRIRKSLPNDTNVSLSMDLSRF